MTDERELKNSVTLILVLMWFAGFLCGWNLAHWFLEVYLP